MKPVPMQPNLPEATSALGTVIKPKQWVECAHCKKLSPLEDREKEPIANQPEPVAWMSFNAYGEEDDVWYVEPKGDLPEGWTYKPLYYTPPKKEWVGLTDEEIFGIFGTYIGDADYNHKQLLLDAKRIEQALKEKNG
jgi:hypothetical protein